MSVTQKGRAARRAAMMLGLASMAMLGGAAPGATDDGKSRLLAASLTGAKEVPPADPDGSGRARIELKGDQVCFTLSWKKIGAPFAAHVHKAASGVNGPVVVPIFLVPDGIAAPISQVGGCATASTAVVKAIRERPRDYYVNVHNTAFPGGAIRGQLHS
jgi:CHRD domain